MARTKCGLWESSSLKLKLPLASVLVRATSSIPWPRPNRMTSSPAAALPVVPFLTVPVRDCATPNEESRKIVTAIWNFRQRSFKATSGKLRILLSTVRQRKNSLLSGSCNLSELFARRLRLFGFLARLQSHVAAAKAHPDLFQKIIGRISAGKDPDKIIG